MIKYCCNRCQIELGKEEMRHRVRLAIQGYGQDGMINADYCKKCLTEIVGAETLAEIEEAKEERKRRIEEKRAERLAKANNEH